MEILKKIEDIFATFHDGTIEDWNGNSEKLLLKISCEYLAEILDQTFEYFYVELNNVSKLELLTYSNDNTNVKNQEPNIVCEFSDIFSEEIDIFYAKTVNSYVEINCWQTNAIKNYVANAFLISCDEIKIYDQNKIEISDEKLFEISDLYWSNFGNKK